LLKEKMLKSSPPAVQGWKVHRRETVAVQVDYIWFRALFVKKIEGQNINPINKSTQKSIIQSISRSYLDLHFVPIL
jgi:hypothetical protein